MLKSENLRNYPILKQALAAGWLLLALVFCFVLQNYFFNLWLNIDVQPFFVRRSIATAAGGLLLFGPALLLNKKIKYFYLGLVSLLVSLIFIAQYLYYSYSGGFLQASALFYASEGFNELATVKLLLTYRLLFFLLGPLFVFFSWLSIRWRLSTEKIFSGQEKIAIGIFILLFSAAGYGYLIKCEYQDNGNAADIYDYSRLYDVNELVNEMGVINFFIGDAVRLSLLPAKATAAEIGQVQDYKRQLSAPQPGKDFGSLSGRNLIIIQVESLENAVIGQKYNGQVITPNLNGLAGSGLYFSHYYSPIGPGTTADAEFMTLNSLYPLPDSVAFINYAFDRYAALPGLLKDAGYHTCAFHGDVPSFWNRSNIYPQLGYEKWFGRGDYLIPRQIGAFDLGDKDFFTQSLPKLQSLPRPFMATLITLSSHTPFQLPADLETMDIPATTTLNSMQQQYLQSIHYTDQAIGDFINGLKTAGLYDNSLIVIFGDHGSFTGISSALGFDNSAFADLQTTEIPLIILAPGSTLSGTEDIPASHLDLYPTVADLLGLKPPIDIFGQDLIAEKNPIAVSRNLVSGTIKSIVTDKLAYHAADNGVFADGSCLEMPVKKILPVSACQPVFFQEQNAVNISDLMVRGNLISAP